MIFKACKIDDEVLQEQISDYHAITNEEPGYIICNKETMDFMVKEYEERFGVNHGNPNMYNGIPFAVCDSMKFGQFEIVG